METEIKNIKVAAISTTVQNKIRKAKDLFKKSKDKNKFKASAETLGVEQSYFTEDKITTVDLCYASSLEVMQKLKWNKNDVQILVFVTQTPDYLMPSCSNILQKKLKLNNSCVCYDINLGCSGYVYGLWNICSVMEHNSNLKKGILAVGDTISKTILKNDEINKLLFGDSGSATAIQKKQNQSINFILGSDGRGSDKLMIKQSGFRGKKGKPYFFMNGIEVFHFAILNVPNLIKRLLIFSKKKMKNIKYYIFHQANKFMIDKISENLKIEKEKMLYSIREFGNTSSASIPTTICANYEKFKSKKNNNQAILAGFGAGYSYAAAHLDLSKTKIFKINKI